MKSAILGAMLLIVSSATAHAQGVCYGVNCQGQGTNTFDQSQLAQDAHDLAVQYSTSSGSFNECRRECYSDCLTLYQAGETACVQAGNDAGLPQASPAIGACIDGEFQDLLRCLGFQNGFQQCRDDCPIN